MLISRFSFIYLILLCIHFPVFAQPYYFNHYQINEGLSNNAVICSMQDSYGFLWFGTKDGLNRFDGNTFKQFANIPKQKGSLGSNVIISLKEDYQKRMWIGTDQGIYSYNPLKEEFTILHESFRNMEVPIITTDSQQRMWFVSNGMLYSYHLKSKQIHQITKSDLYVTSIGTTRTGKIYFGTPEGKIYQVSNTYTYTLFLDLLAQYGNNDWFSIQKIFENKDGDLLIGTSKAGVFIYQSQTSKLTSILGQSQLKQFLYVRDILQPNDDEYWFATESGLFIYQISTKTFVNLKKEKDNPWGISDNAIYNILLDRDQGVWLGTYFGGLNYYHRHNSVIEKVLPRNHTTGLEGSVVRAIKKDRDGHIWIGTENGGLAKWNVTTNKIDNFSTENSLLSNNNIHGMLPVQDKILVGSFVNGLDIFDVRQRRVVKHLDRNSYVHSDLESNFIFYFYQTRAGDILAASTKGLYRFDYHTLEFHAFKNLPIPVFYTTILEDHAGNLWIGTWRDGLFCYHPKTQYFKHFIHDPNDSQSLPNNRINSLFEDSQKQLWVATEGGMARKHTNKDGFQNISIQDGLPSNVVLAILEDRQNNLWTSTSKGLVRYHLFSHKLRVFNMESGLPTLQFNYNSSFDDDQGNLYFGTINGLIRFNPEKLNNITYNSTIPIYITNLYVNNEVVDQRMDSTILKKSILFTDNIRLKHDESSFSLDFAALHYQAPHSIMYSYKMEGLDETWNAINGNHRAYFTKLAPGDYTFIVKAEDPNGVTIPKFKTLKIKILPPIWASMGAFLLYGIIFLGLISFIIHHFNEKIKQRNRQHLLTIQNMREQELYRSKINFYTNVAHEIRTPLSLIRAPLEKLMEKVDRNQTIDKLLLTMQNNTDKLIALSNQLLDFRKVEAEGFKLHFESHNISEILQDIINNFTVTLAAKEKNLICHIQENIIALIDLDAFEKICYNLLNNALKYSEGQLEVRLEKDQIASIFSLTIKNDGALIPIEERERIFEPFNRLKYNKNIPGSGLGLALTKSLALKHQGALIYQVDPSDYNIFVLTLPINQSPNQHYESKS